MWTVRDLNRMCGLMVHGFKTSCSFTNIHMCLQYMCVRDSRQVSGPSFMNKIVNVHVVSFKENKCGSHGTYVATKLV